MVCCVQSQALHLGHTAQPGESTGSNLKLITQRLLVCRPQCLGADILRLKISALYLVPCYLLPKIERALGIQSSSLALVATWAKAPEEQSSPAQVRRHLYHNLTENSSENHRQQTLKLVTPLLATKSVKIELFVT